MAKQDLADNGKTYTDPNGTTWEQVSYRKLSSGEYMRVMLEQYGRRLLVQFGEVLAENKDLIAWRWQLPLLAEDAICLVGDMTFAQFQATKNTTAYVVASAAKIVDLESKVVALATELRDLKDAPPTSVPKEGSDAAKAG